MWSPMTTSAQQAFATWQGSPYEAELTKHIKPQSQSIFENGEEAAPSYIWKDGGEEAFRKYLQQQARLDAQRALNPAAASGLVDVSAYSTASDMAAAVAQAQYDNWRATYFPAMQAARDMTTYANPGIVNTEVQKAGSVTEKAFESAAGRQSRSFARFGLTPSARQQTAIDDALSLDKSTAMADATNRVREGLSDRNKSIMAGSVTNFTAKV